MAAGRGVDVQFVVRWEIADEKAVGEIVDCVVEGWGCLVVERGRGS